MVDLRRRAVSIDTALGPIRAEFSDWGLCRLDFDHSDPLPSAADEFSRQLQRYATGQPVQFSFPLDLRAGTPFQQAVWRVLLQIPRGETRSYAWVAREVGRPAATRAVGAACGANPIPILVPCHRVVASDGSLGGFSGGLDRKRQLLALER